MAKGYDRQLDLGRRTEQLTDVGCWGARGRRYGLFDMRSALRERLDEERSMV